MNTALKNLSNTVKKTTKLQFILYNNFSTKLVAIDYNAPDAAEQFVKSLKETGFGVLKNHPIKESTVQSIYDNWYNFFQSEKKHDFYYNVGKQDGYFPPEVSETAKGHTKKDIKEYFHVYPWGQIPEELNTEIMDYYNNTSDFAKELLNWIEEHSPKEVKENFKEPLSSMIHETDQTLLRVLHYPPMTGDEEPGAIRAAAHEDINLITILPSSNEPGLQVLTKENEWIDVPCEFGNLIINTGDMLQEASGHYFKSTSHRVINPSGKATQNSRLSLPLFLHPRPEVKLSDKYTAHSYLQERLRELGVIV